MDLIGRQFGSIRIDALLGSGGMGEVYLATDLRLERKVAVKALNDRTRFSPESKARLSREAKVLSRLGDPAICQIHDWLETPEGDLLVLEFVEGMTLRDHWRQQRPELADVLQVVRAIAGALKVAHRERIVHRDLKPDNVMIGPDQRVKVLDFGIARIADLQPAEGVAAIAPLPDPGLATQPTEPLAAPLRDRGVRPDPVPATRAEWDSTLTEQGIVLGTRRYMSPEQAQGLEVQASSDIYSLGVLLEEGLGLLKPPPAPADLPPHLRLLVETMQRVDPTRRPDAAAVIAGIDQALAWPQVQARARLRRSLLGAFVGLVVLAAVIVGYFAWQAERQRAKAEVRQAQAEKLIQFMLGDLRTRLNRIGKLDLLAGVNERAEEYFAAIPAGELGDQDLAARVQSLLQVAEVAKEQGDVAAAERATESALALAEDLRRRDPGNPETLDRLAAAKEWRAFLKLDQLDGLAQAARWFDEAAQLRGEVVALRPADPAARRNLASAYNNLGSVRHALGEPDAALADLARSTAAWDAVLAAAPGDPEALGNRAGALGWRSSVELALGRWSEAAATRAAQVADLEDLVAQDPDHAAHREDLAVALRYLAELEARFTGLAPARGHWARARMLAARARDNEPASVDVQRLVATIELSEGEGLLLHGQLDEAAMPLVSARDRLNDMIARDSGNPDLQWLRARARIGLASIHEARQDDAAFATEVRGARDGLEPLLALEGHAADARRGLLEAALLQARADARRGAMLAADSALAVARRMAPETLSPHDLEGQRLAFLEAELRGDREAAARAARILRDAGYRWARLDPT